jgi:hypothetical protein
MKIKNDHVMTNNSPLIHTIDGITYLEIYDTITSKKQAEELTEKTTRYKAIVLDVEVVSSGFLRRDIKVKFLVPIKHIFDFTA